MNKQDLIYQLEKRFKTTMIGSLAKFEDKFSHLWEDDNQSEERKEYYYNLWQDARDEILNNGNNQARSAIKELKSYLYPNTVKYKQNFYFNKGEDNYGN